MDAAGTALAAQDDDRMRQTIERLLNAATVATAVHRSTEELRAAGRWMRTGESDVQ